MLEDKLEETSQNRTKERGREEREGENRRELIRKLEDQLMRSNIQTAEILEMEKIEGKITVFFCVSDTIFFKYQ